MTVKVDTDIFYNTWPDIVQKNLQEGNDVVLENVDKSFHEFRSRELATIHGFHFVPSVKDFYFVKQIQTEPNQQILHFGGG